MSPTVALRDALETLLLDDAAVRTFLTDRIHDRVPDKRDGLVFPFAAFGPMRQDRLETGGAPAWTVKIRLYTAATDYERDPAWTGAQAIADAIEGAEPDLVAPWSLSGPLTVGMVGDAIETNLPKTVFLDVVGLVHRAG